MLVNTSNQFVINTLSDMFKISLARFNGETLDSIGTISNYDYVEINNKKLIFYTEKDNNSATTFELELDKIDFVDFDAELIALK